MYNVKIWGEESELIPPEHLFTPNEQEVLTEILDRFFSYNEEAVDRYQKEQARRNSYDGWTARRRRSNSRVSVIKEREAWNYHDDSWTYYELLTVEKLSRSEFEQNVSKLISASGSSTDDSENDGQITSRIGHLAKQCFELPRACCVRGTLDTWEIKWSSYSEAYMTGFENISGCYRFVYAYGSDRD